MKLSRRVLTLAAALIIAGSPRALQAAPQLQLSDGSAAVLVTDGDGLDMDATPGIISYNGPVGANWFFNGTTGFSKPASGSPFSPFMDFATVNLSSQNDGKLTIELTDNSFMAEGLVKATAAIGGNTVGSVGFKTWADSGNVNFAKTTPLTEIGPLSGPTFSGNNSQTIQLTAPYSLTLQAIIDHPVSGLSGFDANLAIAAPPGCPGDKTVDCSDSLDPDINSNLGKPQYAPPAFCGAATMTYQDTTTSGTNCSNDHIVSTVTRVWTITDPCNNTNYCTQTITVQDTNAPVFTKCASDVSLGCNPNSIPGCDATQVAATDNCGTPMITCSSSDMRSGCTVTRTITYKATDACGNSSICAQKISWTEDTKAPLFTKCPSDLNLGCNPTQIPDRDLSQVAASDDCNYVITADQADTTNGCVRVRTVTYTATDGCNNKASCVQRITWMVDTNEPTITRIPSGGELGCASIPTDASIKALVEASDDCGMPTINVTHVDGGTTCSPTCTFTITATDSCNNTSAPKTVAYTNTCNPCVASTFNFNGSSLLSGVAGNIRTYTTNGISVNVSAFSRTKTVDGTWEPAYLGAYNGGLGVTDTGEGNGGNNSHTVDNIDRFNVVLFEFSQPVVLNRAYLGYVVSDSDLSLAIGTFNNPYNNHLTLSDSVITSFSYGEENLTDLSAPRWAELNTNAVVGNVIVIAALATDTSPEDQFKISLLDICKPACQPVIPCSANVCGSVVRDCNADGKLSGETGISGITVKLKNKTGTVVATTTTDSNGSYCFNNITVNGTTSNYTVVVTSPLGYTLTAPSGCNNQQILTLSCGQNKTGVDFGYTGSQPGIYFKKTGPATAVCGQTITYTFAVTNTGNTCFYGGLHVDDPMLGGQIFHQTPVAPGEGFVFTKTYVVKSTDPINLVNNATATGHPPIGSAFTVSSSWTVKVTPCTPCKGSICGAVVRDCNADGDVADAEDGDGIAGVTVKLKNSGGTVVATTTTAANGSYCFNDLAVSGATSNYTVVVTQPANYGVTYPASCNNQQKVTLSACQNKTGVNFGYTGTSPNIYFKKTGIKTSSNTITYTFCVTNTGNTCFYGGLHVDDPKLGGEIFHKTPVTPGQGFQFTKAYTIKSSDPAYVTNTATATGHPPLGNAFSVQSTAIVKK